MKLRTKRIVIGFISATTSYSWLALTYFGHQSPRWHAWLAGILGGIGTVVFIAGLVKKD